MAIEHEECDRCGADAPFGSWFRIAISWRNEKEEIICQLCANTHKDFYHNAALNAMMKLIVAELKKLRES